MHCDCHKKKRANAAVVLERRYSNVLTISDKGIQFVCDPGLLLY